MTEKLTLSIFEIIKNADKLCRKITADLPEYFGIPEANEHYAQGVLTRTNLAAQIGDEMIGLVSLEFPYPNNANIYWMGVMKQYQGCGVGTALFAKAEGFSLGRGAKTITVETLAPSECDANYSKTYNFYSACGFRPFFNLKPDGYSWNMVYMGKTLQKQILVSSDINIRLLRDEDVDMLVDAFARHQWTKAHSTFEGYLREQRACARQCWIATHNNEPAGYVTLNLVSHYQPFATRSIPEIMDLNVLPPFRKNGIGSALLDVAEHHAAKESSIVGIGVGLYEGYGDAQKIYVKRGYVPDGSGPTYRYTGLQYGQSVCVDDDLVLWFTKGLNK